MKKREQKLLPLNKNLVHIAYVSVFLAGFFAVSLNTISAQSACTDQVAGKSRAQLEAELEACNREIEEWTATLNMTRQESASFSRDIEVLTAKINTAKANIKSRNNQIALLTRDIAIKQNQISDLDARINAGKKAIADILRKTNDINSFSLVEAVFSDKDLSEFFLDLDTYASTEKALANLFRELREVKGLTESEKAALNRKKEAEAAAKAALEASKKEVEIANEEKKTLLAINKTKEKTYEQVVADRKAKAAQIKAVLFPLRDAEAIPFGTALQYAEHASSKTGVRPALILAILQQESNLGANVGSCVITDLQSGQTKSVNSGSTFLNGIHPLRDLPIIQSILNELGRNPLNTRVSCPVSHTFGYGGAMGPAQFIPSTWNIMKSKVTNATGNNPPDPWSPPDAIMAMALFLEDLRGTTGDPFIDERTSACRYYSGQTCFVGGKAGRGLSYGRQVMNRAEAIQRDIDFLQGV